MKEYTKLLSVADAAKRLQTTPANVRRMVYFGKLSPTVVSEGGIKLFSESSVLALVSRRAERNKDKQ